MFSMSRPSRARMLRPSALTTPVDTVDCNPSGLPIAITSWPTRSASLSPSCAYGRPLAAKPNHGQIGCRIVADQFRPQPIAVGRLRRQLRPIVDDVAVRDRVAVRRHDEPGASAAAPIRIAAGNADHRRRHRLDDVNHRLRIGVEQIGIAGRLAERLDRGMSAVLVPLDHQSDESCRSESTFSESGCMNFSCGAVLATSRHAELWQARSRGRKSRRR